MGARYFLGHDNDGHDYVVPVAKRDEWFAWLDSSDDAVEAPSFAVRVDGRLTFTDPDNG